VLKMTGWSKWLACAWIALLPGAAGAVSLSLVPTPVEVTVGTGFALNLRIENLAGASVGGFDVDFAFDPTQISFVGATFASLLGDVGLGEALTDVIVGAGTLNVSSVSLLSPQALALLQGDPLLLATLSFQAVGPGSSSILITNAEVSDARASAVSLDSFAPVPVHVAVPEPTALLPLSLGLALVLLRLRPQTDRVD
jgi:hypothetical protein